ncbi:MAG TPA: radical SAM protein [Anaeromyxobacteraceae bacterium]|nr:radical SAM protein [Anaeromyxobacteraceae bacterium]
MRGWLTKLAGRSRRRFAAWQIELTTRCPLDCRMCIRQGREWRNADMRLEDFARLAPLLRDVETVVLQGWGEPLLRRDLVEVVRLAKRAGGERAPGEAPAVGFVTSGQGLDRRRAEALVDAGLDFIGFSLAGATPEVHGAIRVRSDLDEVVEAAQALAAAKRERGLDRPRVHAVCLMVKDNVHQLPQLPEVARRMGAVELVLTNLVDVSDAWQDGQRVFAENGEEAHRQALEETERRARQAGLAFRRPSLSPRVTAVCEENPLRNLYLTVEGDAVPCVYLCPPVPEQFPRWFCGAEHQASRVRFGNLLREPLDAVWASPAYAAFRDRFDRRLRRHRLLSSVGRAWRAGAAVAEADLPAPPEPCRICHKMLGV